MNKKHLLLAAGIFVIIFFIAFVFTLFSSQSQTPGSSYPPSFSPSPSSIQSSNFISEPVIQATTAPENLTPEEVARKFYSWYLTYPGVSALSKGAYNDNIYLSDKFKRVISRFAPYSDSEDPVFCIPNKLSNFTVLPATTTSNGRQGVIIQSVPEGKNLYKIILKNINNRWLVDDTICVI